MDAAELLDRFCRAVERRDGAAVAALFTEDGAYHDVFYGLFEGRAAIAALINDRFYRDATDFRWDMLDPVSDGRTLYARYLFSYRSLLPEANGARAMFEGVSILRLRDGAVTDYREVADVGPALVRMNFAGDRIARLMARHAAALAARPEMARHLG